MRAHCLFFDECYNEENYQADTIMSIMKDCDLLIVAGTMLETSLPNRMVQQHLKKDRKLIEINIEPILDMGVNVMFTRMPSEKSLPLIVNAYLSSLKPKEIIKNASEKKESCKKVSYTSKL